MKRGAPRLRKKCLTCRVARKVGGCLFNCSREKKLVLELRTLIDEARADVDPLLEQLRQCPEVFDVGKLLGSLATGHREPDTERVLPPGGTIISPFV